MKETFRDLYRQPDLRSAKGFLKGWLTVAKQSALKPTEGCPDGQVMAESDVASAAGLNRCGMYAV
jgi:hypothetical protein